MTDHCDVQTFFRFERSFCRCMAVMSCALGWCVCDLTCFQMMWLVVRWFVVLLQRTTLYYKVLLQYYSVLLQSTTPVLLCTITYYSSTTLYYKELRQYYNVLPSTTMYYSVLQSTTPVLLCTTKYYNVLPRYYSVLQSTTPVLLCTTPVLQRTTPVLLCTTQYYNVLLCTTKYYNVLLRYFFETSFPMRGASQVTLQPHQILRLPRNLEGQDLRGNPWSASANRKTIRG